MPYHTDTQFGLCQRNQTNEINKYENNKKSTEIVGTTFQQETSPREADNIMEIRKLLREQSNLSNKAISKMKHSNSDSSDEFEIPLRRFTPLPDIPRSDDVYFRTESKLMKESKANLATTLGRSCTISNESNSFLEQNQSPIVTTTAILNPTSYSRLKETRYHFGGSNTTASNKINFSHRLPALEKTINHSLQNTMDLDEDLPINPVCIGSHNQRNVYTSPGDRIISPIKRPQAPSPPTSAFRRKTEDINIGSSDSEFDDDLIQ